MKELKFPIEIKDKKLIDKINEISEKKQGAKVTLKELTEIMGEIERARAKWWEVISDKYNIPESMRENGSLKYNSEKHIITPSDWED